MPWKGTTMSQRQEFVRFALAGDANIRELCRRYGISPTTAYKLIGRYDSQGPSALADRSRRPLHSPSKTSPVIEQAVVRLRKEHPRWGSRKILRRLRDPSCPQAKGLDLGELPASSTVTDILRRHGLIDPQESVKHQPWQRFEKDHPNDLWQMDFKGHFAVGQQRCHPLVIVDDHSRFSLCLHAFPNEHLEPVRSQLEQVFGAYGLPVAMLCDNGRPWGASDRPYTKLSAWMIRLGIRVSHGRCRHPQTQGKVERFNRTLKAEALWGRHFEDMTQVQQSLDAWRGVYNLKRPHEALGMAVPASRYQPSPRNLPRTLPPIEYGPGDQVRMVQSNGYIHLRGRTLFLSEAFAGQPVALRPTEQDGLLEVYYCHQKIDQIDLKTDNPN